MSYTFLQEYWWFLISLLAGLLVFLMFVQGANTLIFRMGTDETERSLIINSTGRKWEFTFTTLVTFGGAFFASFPLFYSTSFGGAYWVWMLILVSFVLQAVAYEFQSKPGNLLGRNVYRRFLVLNGVFGPLLVGTAVGTFFHGAAFVVSKDAISGSQFSPVISQWANSWHGLDAVGNPWNLVLGLTVLFLARILGSLYLVNNIEDRKLTPRLRRQVLIDTIPFLVFFLSFVVHLCLIDGFAVSEEKTIYMQPHKYWKNLIEQPMVLSLFLIGVILVLFGILRTLFHRYYYRGIWPAGMGTVLTVMALFMLVGYNNTAYYPSTADLQSSLTLTNSCSSRFTLNAMTWVSILIPFVLAYIVYAWYRIDAESLTRKELNETEHKY